MTTSRRLTAALLAIGVALLATSMAGPALGARGERRNQREQRAERDAPTAVIASVRDNRHRLARSTVARRLTRIADPAADQLSPAGERVAEAPAWTDISAVYMAPFRLSRRMLRSINNNFPLGSAGAFRGPDADWSVGDRGLFVVVELAEGRPDDLISQLVEIGVDGAAAGPVQVGSATDTRAGVAEFTLGGRFNNGSETAGTTDVSGRAPGDSIDYYNARSRVFGVYDQRDQTYLLLLPERRDTRSLAISLRSVTDQGEVIDRLELPGGGHLVPLSDPGLGFKAAEGALPLGCRALATASIRPATTGAATTGAAVPDDEAGDETSDGAGSGDSPAEDAAGGDEPAPDEAADEDAADPTDASVAASTTIRYTAGVGRDPETGELADVQQVLGALDGMTAVPMRLERLDEDAEPLEVDARLTLAPALGAFSLSMDVPPGQWTFAPTDGERLVTPAGEALIDHATLTGRAGVRTGDGLNGFVSGNADCGRWDLGVAACELVPAGGLEALVPTGDTTLEQAEISQPDGSSWCVGRIPGTRDAKYIVRFGRDYATKTDLAAASEASGCPATAVDIGSAGFELDCAAQGAFERFIFLAAPEATAEQDAAGGILVSLDMVVDPGRPVGERYDRVAALDLLGSIADGLAASATAGGAQG